MRSVIAGNWKMHKTVPDALQLVRELFSLEAGFPADVDVIVAPPFTALEAVAQALRGQNRIRLSAQTMHWKETGAYTGEISPAMLVDIGVRYVILGHSERRQLFGETDEYVRLKTAAALTHGLTPIVAVGETLEEHKAGRTMDKVASQIRAALQGLLPEEIARCVVAYEPIWAIGSGMSDDPDNANEVMRCIRGSVEGLEGVPLIYGGSVRPDNIAAFAAQSDVNGALVGGASLNADSFSAIIRAAQNVSA
ncbi:MAG: triose-phosphate isomerase [Candidatus Eremiobacteraeota bacterium]|nr:triose-phosphate isomerase [Candidatus Eremiobacteraeota bacterium]